METLNFKPGDKVALQTKDKTWEGHAIESHDPEIVLLKIKSGYNIGLRQREIIEAKILEESTENTKEDLVLQKNPKLKNVAMIITGGTISSRLDPKTGGVISTDAEEILKIAPEISKICNIVKIEKPFMKFSEDMDPKDWTQLAKTSEELLNNEEVDGLIITHGTDTLHFTSSALAFFLKDLNKPIALTYSQRSIDRGSTDAALNLICAAKYATSDIAEVALVGHENNEDNSCLASPATKVRKMHTSKRDTFKIINSQPLARITPDSFEILTDSFNARSDSKVKLDAKYSNQITLIQIHPGQDPSIIEYYQEKGYKGLILQTTGLGQVPGKESSNNWLPKIKKAIESGMTICATPQTIYGRLNPNVYSSGRDLQKTGIIFLEDMLPETALVKLGWILGHTSWAKDSEKIKEKMLENISREFTIKIKE